MTTAVQPDFGALVLSLDFELHWGVRDHAPPDGPYRANLLGVWDAVPRTLALFAEYGVAATWATVGLLLAGTREEQQRHWPARRPAYVRRELDAYVEPVGAGEGDDRLHFAPSLVDAIARTPRQEIGTHTFAHHYCLEPGQTRDDFAADLGAAVAVAAARGLATRSIVFPRNQHNPAYDEVLRASGIVAYRGNARSRLYAAAPADGERLPKRAGRLADAYAPLGDRTVAWSSVPVGGGLFDVAASAFVRPYAPRLRAAEPLRIRRLAGIVRRAARARRIAHLWWHPHNHGRHTTENLDGLRRLLDVYADCGERYGMRSLTMAEAADASARAAR